MICYFQIIQVRLFSKDWLSVARGVLPDKLGGGVGPASQTTYPI